MTLTAGAWFGALLDRVRDRPQKLGMLVGGQPDGRLTIDEPIFVRDRSGGREIAFQVGVECAGEDGERHPMIFLRHGARAHQDISGAQTVPPLDRAPDAHLIGHIHHAGVAQSSNVPVEGRQRDVWELLVEFRGGALVAQERMDDPKPDGVKEGGECHGVHVLMYRIILETENDGGVPMRDVAVTIEADDSTLLRGTLSLPEGAGPFGAALLLQGSGPLDRDGNTRRLRSDLGPALVRALCGAGIASLRYDRRGTGSTTGDWKRSGFHGNRADARAALRMLRGCPGVSPESVAVIGHSEGALHAMGLASGAGVRAAVLLAGYARTGESALRWQASSVLRTLPTPLRLLGRVVAATGLPERALTRVKATAEDTARIGGSTVNARWMREMLSHDTREDLAGIQVPVLAVTGGKDVQVDPEDLKEVTRLCRGEVHTWCPVDLTHLLRSDQDGSSVVSYRRLLRKPVDPDVLSLITSWLSPRLR